MDTVLYYENEHGKLYNCDVMDGLKSLPDNSVDLIVTSPPYWGLRDYGVDGQIGLEKDFSEFLSKLVAIFNECHRVLKKSGNLYVNMGDSYVNNSCPGGGDPTIGKRNLGKSGYRRNKRPYGLPVKNLIGQPWRLAFAFQGFAVMPSTTILEYADLLRDARECGDWEIVNVVENRLRLWAFTEALSKQYILREEIIWAKGNPMPESMTDRCTRAHEYIFHLTKSPKYFYDAYSIRESYAEKTYTTWGNQKSTPADGSGLVKAENFAGVTNAPKDWNRPRKNKQRGAAQVHEGFATKWDLMSVKEQHAMGANKRSVWTVGTKPFKGAHFATFPPDLIAPIVQAACPLGGTVLDIFGGSGTTAYVAEQFQRKWLLFELNDKYCEIAQRRLDGVSIEPAEEPDLTIETFLQAVE